MKCLDHGHEYLLDSYDGGEPVHLTFMKREGEGYPGNVGHYPGTNCQEVIRALVDRVEYLQQQVPCEENITILLCLQQALYEFEKRAAHRHGRELAKGAYWVLAAPTCAHCGHVECPGH